MNKIKILPILLIILSLFSCEDVVQIDVPRNNEKLVVDAQLTNENGPKYIKIMLSQAYFDNTPPSPATGAIVAITDNEGNKYEFTQMLNNDKTPSINFGWVPKGNEVFGKIGNTYTLNINYNGEAYNATTQMKRVPKIDSISYAFKDNSALPSTDATKEKIGYRAEFYARDATGQGDCYIIKGFRYSKKTKTWNYDNTQIAYDAAFQPGARADGLVFILPIRRSITNFLALEGDSIRTELYSITEPHFDFLRAAALDANNQGLFATPPVTFQTNIINTNKNSKKQALGWFSASGISKLQIVIDPKKATADTD